MSGEWRSARWWLSCMFPGCWLSYESGWCWKEMDTRVVWMTGRQRPNPGHFLLLDSKKDDGDWRRGRDAPAGWQDTWLHEGSAVAGSSWTLPTLSPRLPGMQQRCCVFQEAGPSMSSAPPIRTILHLPRDLNFLSSCSPACRAGWNEDSHRQGDADAC